MGFGFDVLSSEAFTIALRIVLTLVTTVGYFTSFDFPCTHIRALSIPFSIVLEGGYSGMLPLNHFVDCVL